MIHIILNKDDRVLYDGMIYEVAAIVFNTLYLQKSNDMSEKYNYTMEEIYKKYHDVEFLREESLHE